MKHKSLSVWPQYLLTILCNTGTLTFGLHLGWLAPLQLRLMSDHSPLGDGVRGFTTEEVSWIASIPSVSFVVGTPVYGFLLQKLGRRSTSLLATIPNVASFVILMFSANPYVIYGARFLAGIASSGSILVTPVYVMEATDEGVRGLLCGLSAFFIDAGVIIATAAGGYFPYRAFNGLCLSFSLAFVAFYPWLPETPVFSVTRRRMGRAAADVRKLRRCNESEAKEEVDRLRDQLAEREKGRSRDARFDEAFRYGMFLALGVMTVHQLSGCGVITAYSVKVFHDCGSTLSPVLASTITNSIRMIGSVTGAFLMDKVNRKSLIIGSLLIMSASLTILGSALFFGRAHHTSLGWLPPILVPIFNGAFSCGIGSVSFVLVTELFPPELRGVSGAVSGAWTSALGFFIIKFFPLIVEHTSIESAILTFAGTCAAGAAFIYCFVIETRGKSQNEILFLLKHRRGNRRTRDCKIEMKTEPGAKPPCADPTTVPLKTDGRNTP